MSNLLKRIILGKKPKPEHWFAYFLIAGLGLTCVMILQVLGS